MSTTTECLGNAAHADRQAVAPLGVLFNFGICASVFLFYGLLALLAGNDGGVISGWIVTDGWTLFRSAQADAILSIPQIIANYEAAAGLAVLHSIEVLIHPLTPWIVNTILLSATYAGFSKKQAAWPLTLTLSLPYYICASILPSKDVLILAMFVGAAHLLLRPNFAKVAAALLIATAMLFVRDGFAAMFGAACVLLMIRERSRINPILALTVVLTVSVIFWTIFESVLEDSFIYARAVAVAGEGTHADTAASPGPGAYFIRLLGNVTNLAFRPVFLDTNGHFNLLSISYWISGVTLLAFLLVSIKAIRSKCNSDVNIAFLALTLTALLSITPYVQPRYLLPCAALYPFYSFANWRMLIRQTLILALMSTVAAFIYSIANLYPPPAEALPLDYSSLIIQPPTP